MRSGGWGWASVSLSEKMRIGVNPQVRWAVQGPQSPFIVGKPLGTMDPDTRWKLKSAKEETSRRGWAVPGRTAPTSPSPNSYSSSISDDGAFHTFSEFD